MSESAKTDKLSDGPNARPRDESIAQSAGGLPNDTSGPVDLTPEDERRIEKALTDETGPKGEDETEAHPS